MEHEVMINILWKRGFKREYTTKLTDDKLEELINGKEKKNMQ